MKKIENLNEITDKKIEIFLGNLLRVGVIASGFVVILGAILFFIRHGFEYPDYHSFKLDPFKITTPGIFLNEILELKSIAILQLGILLLIATPILRVISSVIAFLYEKDFMYVGFSLIVFLVLVFSFFS